MAFGRKPFTSQPQYAVEIDSSHPSASGLVRCSIPASRRDLSLSSVKGELLTHGPRVPSLNNKIGLQGTGSNPVSYTTGYNLSTNARQTFLFSGVMPSQLSLTGWFRSGISSSFDDIFFCAWSSAVSAWYPRARVAGTNLFTTPSLYLQPHQEVVIALRAIAGVSLDIWWDGVQKLSATTTASFANQSVFHWGTAGQGATRGIRELQGMWVWDRALGDGELSSLTQNPWQLFRPVQNNVYLFAPPSGAGTDTLLANDLQSLSTVSTATLGQTHSLLANDLQSVSTVSTGALGQLHGLLANDLQSTSSVSTPSISQSGSLLANDLQSLSTVSTATLGQKHNLLANDLASLSTISTPSIGGAGVVNALLANDLQSLSTISIPVLRQKKQVNYATSVSLTSLTGKTFYHNSGKWFGY